MTRKEFLKNGKVCGEKMVAGEAFANILETGRRCFALTRSA